MPDPHTINANVAECLREASHIGFDRIHNVCNGSIVDVPWGGAAWAGVFALAVMLLVFGFVFLGLGISIFKELRRGGW